MEAFDFLNGSTNHLKNIGGSIMKEVFSFIKFVILLVLFTSGLLAFGVLWLLFQYGIINFY